MTIQEVPIHVREEQTQKQEVKQEYQELNPIDWRTNLTIVAVFLIIVCIIWAICSYNSKPSVKPSQKSAIQILTDTNISFMNQIWLQSEKKKELVIQKNGLDEQIKRIDSTIQVYSSKIDSNAAQIDHLTTNNQ